MNSGRNGAEAPGTDPDGDGTLVATEGAPGAGLALLLLLLVPAAPELVGAGAMGL